MASLPLKNFIGNLGNPMGTFKNPTHMLPYDGVNNQPLRLAKIDFIHPSEVLLSWLPE